MDSSPGDEAAEGVDAARAVFGEGWALADSYREILAARGVEWGLIGPRERTRLWERHILNSLAVSPAVPGGALVVDVGSGAGLPGIPLAISRPDLRVVLLEPLLRRANFLTMAVAELGLEDRVSVVRARAEEHQGRYDVVTCRAVAPLARLVGWTCHLMGADGRLVALKGESASEEIAGAAGELRRRGLRAEVRVVRVHPGAAETRLVVVSHTPASGDRAKGI